MIGQCENCAYYEKDWSGRFCKLCIRNPKNVTKTFKPTVVGGISISSPIDFYISKEHYSILMVLLKLGYTRFPKYPPWLPIHHCEDFSHSYWRKVP